MYFNVDIDKQIGERLERLAKDRGTSRNSLIREALSRFLDNDAKREWPDSVLRFEGIRGTPRFENARRKLRAPRKDPLA